MTFRLARKSLSAGAMLLALGAAAACDSTPRAVAEQAGETAPAAGAATEAVAMTVYKSPTCGCCTKWVEHMEANGFRVEVKDMDNVAPVKDGHGVPSSLRSCHTGVVDGYVVEGHVPADVVVKLLRERPQVAGIAVPGMPMGSPGMEGSYSENYDVLTFDGAGKTTVYAKR